MLSNRAQAVLNPLRCVTRRVNKIQQSHRSGSNSLTIPDAARIERVQNRLIRCVHDKYSDRDLSRLSYFHVTGKEPLLPWTVGQVIDRSVDVFGDTKAMVSYHQDISKTYTEYKKDVDQLAASLVSLKLPLGSRVAILSPRLYEGALLLYAAPKAGLVMVGIHTLCTASELETSLNKAECAALILGEKFTDKKHYEMLLQIAPELEKSTPGELKSQRLPFLKHVVTIGNTRKPGTMTFDDLVNSVTAEDYATMNSLSAKVQFDQDAFVQFSSGTTGQPKPARLSHFNVVNNANLVGRFVGYHRQRESICLNADLVFGFGRNIGVIAATIFGSTIVLPGPNFSPKTTLEAISRHRCTVTYGPSTVFFDMLRELEKGTYDVSSLRKGIMGGTLCNPAIVEEARTSMNIRSLYIVYGGGETSPVITCTNPDEPTDRWIRTVGKPLDHVEVKVVDAEGKLVPVNTSGELCTRGPHVFKGYLNDDARTNEAIRNGWYHTGDEATMSEDGQITFVGRIKERINYRGLKVSPLKVENVLNTHRDVEEAQVIGVPDERVGEKICAWIKLQADKTLTQEDIKAFCKDKLQSYWIPEHVLFVDSFPRTQTGKVQKHKMREQSVQLLNL